MANENDILDEADEIAALLPWYVSGKISDNDRARVDAYRRAHPEVEAQLVLAREEADVVFAENSAIPAPHDALRRLRESIADSPRARLHAARTSLVDRIGGWLQDLGPRRLAYAGLAAALLVVAQVASIGSLLSERPGQGGYQTASGAEVAAASGTFALVAFQPGVTVGTISAFLSDNGFKIADGPRAGGLYRLRISDKEMSASDQDAAISKLKARGDVVSFVSAAPKTP